MVTKMVTVQHTPALSSEPALVAALNAAHLDASLKLARQPVAVSRSWVPPAPILVAAALLVISCVHYLHGPTGGLAFMTPLTNTVHVPAASSQHT